MGHHLAAYAWLLEDVHGLDWQGNLVVQAFENAGDPLIAGEGPKCWVQVMQRMAHFVHAQFFCLFQLPCCFIKGLFLEEEADAAAALEKVVIGDGSLISFCSENGADSLWVKFLQQLIHASFQLSALFPAGPGRQDQETVLSELLHLLRRESHISGWMCCGTGTKAEWDK